MVNQKKFSEILCQHLKNQERAGNIALLSVTHFEVYSIKNNGCFVLRRIVPNPPNSIQVGNQISLIYNILSTIFVMFFSVVTVVPSVCTFSLRPRAMQINDLCDISSISLFLVGGF